MVGLDCTKINKGLYCILLLLCGSQIIALVHTHSLVARLTLCDTIMFTIIMFRKILTKSQESLEIFLRLTGIIVFEALIFVTFTHGLEIVFQGSHEMHIPKLTVIVVICDIIIKTILLTTNKFPKLGLNWFQRIILHYIATITVLATYCINIQYGDEKIDYLTKIDPYMGIILSIILTIIIIPTVKTILPFFMANKPTSFSIENFSKEVEDKFTDVKCNHVHAYKKWSTDIRQKQFDVFMHIDIIVDEKSEKWIENSQNRIIEVINGIQDILKNVGANQITIEPRIIHNSTEEKQWTICTTVSCQANNLTCCGPQKYSINKELQINSSL